jgi:hypothetical protein
MGHVREEMVCCQEDDSGYADVTDRVDVTTLTGQLPGRTVTSAMVVSSSLQWKRQ